MKGSSIQVATKQPLVIAIAVLVVLLTTLIAIEWYGPIPRPGAALEGKLSETQRTAIDLVVDLAKLFMGWSIAVIGGVGYFLKANFEKEYPLSKPSLFLCEAVILLSVISIFYGHLTINFVVTMLALDVLNLGDPTLAWYIRIHYITFLTSLMLFGAYIHNVFLQRINHNSDFKK